MYWYQDIGLKIPVLHFISDREYTHYSSSAIRELSAYGAFESEEEEDFENVA